MPSSHDEWFRSKVFEALNSKAPDVPHDEAKRRIRENLLKNIPVNYPKEYED